MFENIKKKMRDPNILVFVFYGVALLIIIERLFSLGYTVSKTRPLETAWLPIEYTAAFLMPLAGFAYFCSSKYATNTENKLRMYVVTSLFICALCFCMLGQISNTLVWYGLGFLGDLNKAIENIPGFERKLYSAVRAFTIYLPICIVPPLFPPTLVAFDNEFRVAKMRELSIVPSFTPIKTSTAPKCSVNICKDFQTSEPISVSEERRMETVLIQGATGTGKTSTLMLPMCASDLNLKYTYKEMAKSLAIKALENGYAYINAPYDNASLNTYFSLNFVHPICGKEKEFGEAFSDIIKCKDPDTGKFIFRDLGITVLEPDGKYIEDFRMVADNLSIPVYIIDPLDPDSFGINPFINKSPAKVASIISTVLKGMYESENPDSGNIFFGQVTQQALENLAILLKLMYPRMHNNIIPTLEDMLKALYDYNLVEAMCEEMKKDPVLAPKHNVLIKYFEKNFYTPPLDINGRPVPGTVGSNRRETEQFLYGATTQLDNLMRNKDVRRILCSRDNNIDLDRILAEGGCVTVCTRRGELGALLSKPFGMFYILTMQDAVLRRPGDENTRIPHFFYIDEFPDFVNKETETCFTLFRKYRCGMTIAIQNLSQLERNKSMKFYKEVITSNSKTVIIFGDTNTEDSAYWSKAFGRYLYWDIGSQLDVAPLENIKSPKDVGLGGESISMTPDWTENIKPWTLNELPFRHVYYRTRTAAGKQIFGKGTTDFLDKKYLKKFDIKKYNFDKYISTIPESLNMSQNNFSNNIIEQEHEINDFLIASSLPVVDNRKVILDAENITSDNVEFIDDAQIEIEIEKTN